MTLVQTSVCANCGWLVSPILEKTHLTEHLTDPVQKQEPNSMKLFRLCASEIAAQTLAWLQLLKLGVMVII